MKCCKYWLLCAVLIFSTVQLFSQNNSKEQAELADTTSKLYKKKMEALRNRYITDQSFARGVRENFNIGSWVGEKIADLISSWGAPSRVSTDGAGGRIYVYESTYTNSGSNYTNGYVVTDGYGNVTASRPSSGSSWSNNYTNFKEVYVDGQGKITRIKTGTR